MSDEKVKIISDRSSRSYTGVIFCSTDAVPPQPPHETELTSANALNWFEPYPQDFPNPQLKILSHKIDPSSLDNGFDIPFSKAVIDESIWSPIMYTNLSVMQGGGCAALVDSPPRMILQTPIDGMPFASLVLGQKGHVCKGCWTYSDSSLDLTSIMVGERLYSGWVRDAIQLVSVPQAFLRNHSVWLSKKISDTLRQLQQVEQALNDPFLDDFSRLQRQLHICQDMILTLERRSEFESVVVSAIEQMVTKAGYCKQGPWSALAPAKSSIQLRRADLDIIPRRIESARIAINDRILQRAQLQGLQIAQATQQIAQATMHDSASMKTIAILTMIFLPGTAVASFFSMTMWNWEADTGSGLVSPWLWIYFVVAAPLTGGVILAWSIWGRWRKRQLRSLLPVTAPPYQLKVD